MHYMSMLIVLPFSIIHLPEFPVEFTLETSTDVTYQVVNV